MTQPTVRDRVVTTIANHIGMVAEEIEKAETSHDLGMDSLDDIEVLMEFEEEFEIELDDNFCLSLKSLDEIAAHIEEKL